MAEIEEPRFTTLAERIAALNQQKNFQAPPPTAGKRAPPPPPPVRAASEVVTPKTASGVGSAEKSPAPPPRPVRAATERLPPPLPRRTTELEDGTGGDQQTTPPSRPGPPPLPARSSPQLAPPKLPTRRPSNQSLSVRRNSNSSDVSLLSTVSSLSLNQTRSAASNAAAEGLTPRRLPPTLDQAKLPPLPPSRREFEAKAREAAEQEAASATPSLPPRRVAAEPPRPSLPPRLPSRPVRSPGDAPSEEPSPALPPRRLPPPPASFRPKSALESGFSSSSAPPPAPPPIPLSSRPTFAQIDAATARPSSTSSHHPSASAPTTTTPDCLTCRDFSAPDTLAAQHPTSSLPRHDPVGHLARVLCAPFASATDKARAVFAWCHHNLLYDVHGFLNKCVPRGQTPAESIFSGKAVCEGYARVYEAIAARAGLECVVVTGHGKGYGFTPVKAGQRPPPPDPTGHAWNAVRIDGGVWKLIDACWGAGHLDNNQYKQVFAAEWFTMSNERFGARHFPGDSRHWYRADGRALSWEEYIVGPVAEEPAMWLGDATREGLDESNFAPAQKRIRVNGGGVVRFQFAKVCAHWTPEKHGRGKQMLFGLKVNGADGRKDDILLLESDGFWYYVDVNARDLGAPGQDVSLVAWDTIDGQSARGMTKEEWLRKKGRCGYSIAFFVRWELV